MGLVRPCLNVQIESVQKICRQNLSRIKLFDWPNKLDTTSWQILKTTESVGWTDSVCMYVCMSSNIASMDQPGKVANPARGQLNRENEHSPVPVRA